MYEFQRAYIKSNSHKQFTKIIKIIHIIKHTIAFMS